jgi:hypothetical protein
MVIFSAAMAGAAIIRAAMAHMPSLFILYSPVSGLMEIERWIEPDIA